MEGGGRGKTALDGDEEGGVEVGMGGGGGGRNRMKKKRKDGEKH